MSSFVEITPQRVRQTDGQSYYRAQQS